MPLQRFMVVRALMVCVMGTAPVPIITTNIGLEKQKPHCDHRLVHPWYHIGITRTTKPIDNMQMVVHTDDSQATIDHAVESIACVACKGVPLCLFEGCDPFYIPVRGRKGQSKSRIQRSIAEEPST